MRVAVFGPFDIFRGYGSDVPALCMALEDLGHDVVPFPSDIRPGLPLRVASMLSRSPAGNYDLAILHQPPVYLTPQPWVPIQCRKVVGWSMWEATSFTDADWKRIVGEIPKDPWKDLDMVLAYDSISQLAFKGFSPTTEVKICQGGIEVAPWEYSEHDWDGTFRFCMVGELHQRKDPFVAIEAYRELRAEGYLEDSEFHLKTSIAGLHPAIAEWVPGISIHQGFWSREQMQDFYRNMHVLLAPSRGEGKNLPAMEMLLSGGTCIVTNWGGHTEWVDPGFVFPLDYTLMDRSSGGMDARASKQHLKELMLYAYRNRDVCRSMAAAGSKAIRNGNSWQAKTAEALELIG